MKANHNEGDILKTETEAVVNILKEQFESKSQQIKELPDSNTGCGKYLKRTI